MATKTKRWYGTRRNMLLLCAGAAVCALYYVLQYCALAALSLDVTSARRYIEHEIHEALLLDKGMGCEIPQLDPFAKEVTQFDKLMPRIECHGQDWVKCYHSTCSVIDAVKANVTDITCVYKDILYHSDQKYTIGAPTTVEGGSEYQLVASDHVKVVCTGRQGRKRVGWSGNTLGFQPVPPSPAPSGREDTYNVLLFAFDSTSRNGFIRRMPRSWQTLRELGFTVMEGYNVVGDGTPAALFPILTGRTELELPDVRKSKTNGTLDEFPFIFYKLKEDGYRTAYFEDMAQVGTFQYRFNGFHHQPADHYLRAFYLEEDQSSSFINNWWRGKRKYCVGDTPQFKLMMNITQQFMDLPGKRFIFTFIADITHDDFNMIVSADEDTAAFLRNAMRWSDDTLIVVMGDHGPRYSQLRGTFQGKIEERLPLLAIRLPSLLTRAQPSTQRALEQNARALTTPHDLHATILHVLNMTEHQNPYKVPGADMKRGLSMLVPIPRNRSCSEAGIEPHWCSCLAWQNVSADDPYYYRAGEALVDYINSLFDGEISAVCIPRSLTSIEWVLRYSPNSRLLAYVEARDADGYVGQFKAKVNYAMANETFQVKIVAGPGRGVYEASMTYSVKEDKFVINTRDISRTNAYGKESSCVSEHFPDLNPYCYCRQPDLPDLT